MSALSLSTQRSSFNLFHIVSYRVLVLHLKRFRFTPSFRLEKASDPVTLLRDLVVCSKEVKKN